MTYLGRGRRGGSHLLLTTLLLIPLIPSQTCLTPPLPPLTALVGCGTNHPLQSTPLSFPPSEEKEYICPDPAHICLIPLSWRAHRHVALGRGWSPEYGLNAKDRVHVSVNFSHSTVNMGSSNMCVWMASPSLVQTGNSVQEYVGAFWAMSMRASCSGSTSSQKRSCYFASTNSWRQKQLNWLVLSYFCHRFLVYP